MLVFSLGGCFNFCRMSDLDVQFPTLSADSASAKGTVLIVGGMNTRMEILNQLANEIPRERWRIRQVPLAGISSQDAQPVSRELWLGQLDAAWNLTHRQFPGDSVALLGYSLGAVLALDYRMKVNPEAGDLFLIAPPVSLRWFNDLMLSFAALVPFDLNIPSAALAQYRARSYTPLSHYAALRKIIDSVREEGDSAQVLNTHITVVSSAHDEFAPASGVREWFARKAPQARVEILDKTSKDGLGMAHQIIDQPSLSPEDWQRLRNALGLHFGK